MYLSCIIAAIAVVACSAIPSPEALNCRRRACTREYRPVCGSDDFSYPNDCEFKNGRCRNPDLRAMRRGRCEDTPKEDRPAGYGVEYLNEELDRCGFDCPRVFTPVCASNGQSFSSQCELDKHNCRNPEDRLTFERQGMCAGASSGRDDSEQQESQEVPSSNRDSNDRQRLPSRNRGSNDQQELPSSNRGSNDRQRLPSNNRGSNDQQELPGSNRGSNDRHRGNNRHRGDRKGQRGSSDNGGFVACFRPCRRSFRPVCASNGVTYANRCIFNIAQCRQRGHLRIESRGRCEGKSRLVVDPRHA